MNRKQFCRELLNHGIGFTLSGNQVKITYTTADYKPYQLMPIFINDIFSPRIEKRAAKQIKPSQRKYPGNPQEYQNYLQERAMKSIESLEERTQKRLEEASEKRKAVQDSAREKWRLDPKEAEEKDQEEHEALEEYNKHLESLKRRLPGWRQLHLDEDSQEENG